MVFLTCKYNHVTPELNSFLLSIVIKYQIFTFAYKACCNQTPALPISLVSFLCLSIRYSVLEPSCLFFFYFPKFTCSVHLRAVHLLFLLPRMYFTDHLFTTLSQPLPFRWLMPSQPRGISSRKLPWGCRTDWCPNMCSKYLWLSFTALGTYFGHLHNYLQYLFNVCLLQETINCIREGTLSVSVSSKYQNISYSPIQKSSTEYVLNTVYMTQMYKLLIMQLAI